jgi:hypothetical protein
MWTKKVNVYIRSSWTTSVDDSSVDEEDYIMFN